jgi:hypothetical protein
MTFWVAGAAIGGAVLNGAISNHNTNKAIDAQMDATREANASALQAQREAQDFQQKQLDLARADNAPYRAAGYTALNKLAGAKDFTGADLASEPGYQFGLDQGMKGLTNAAAARGGLLSGAALKASTRYAQDYASTKYGEAFSRDTINKNRLASLAGIGQTAVGQTTAAGSQVGANVGAGILATGAQIGQNALGAGNARASGYLANGNALTGALNQGISAWNQYNRPIATGGNGLTYGNQFSGGNDGWTLPNGESLST